MREPLGRDKLGRLVYEGDRIYWDHLIQDEPWPPLHPFVGDTVRFEGCEWGAKINDRCTVDLTASPKRTNFERYFAGMTTRDEIHDLMSEHCDWKDPRCGQCPFSGWLGTDDCEGFFIWLDEEATI